MNEWRRELIGRYGEDPIAAATLQPDMEYFDCSFGYLAFRRVWGADVALGPPLCSRADEGELLRRFQRSRPRPVFCYLEDASVRKLERGSLHVAGMGVDRVADLAALVAAPPKEMRAASRKARKVGFGIEELRIERLTAAQRQRIGAINTAFLRKAQCPSEFTFLNMPLSLRADPLRRMFALTKHDDEHAGMFGVMVVNAYHRNGRVVGYLLDILRFEATRLWGVWLAAVWELADKLHTEGMELSLGLCPLHALPERHPCDAAGPLERSLHRRLQRTERYLGKLRYLVRLRQLKSAIPGEDRARYFASFSPHAAVNLALLIKASGLQFRTLLGPDLVRSVARGTGLLSAGERSARLEVLGG